MSRTPSPDRIPEHLRRLREDPQSVNPPGWRVDYADGPWPVKVHQGGTRVAPEGPLARVLRGSVAVTAVRGTRAILRRAVPSGGAMHPTEAYVVCTRTERLWHVDPYRMELLALPADRPGRLVRAGLRLSPGAALPPVVLVLTSRFWKNFYKYGDFSFRLGAVDAGVVLGRVLRLAEAEFGTACVRTDFVDDALNAALGLDGLDESVYAVVGCGHPEEASGSGATAAAGPAPSEAPRLRERSRRVKRSPVFDLVQRSAHVPTPGPARAPASAPVAPQGAASRAGAVALPPPVPVDLNDLRVIVRRRSGGRSFTGRPADLAQLSTVLRHADAAGALLRDRADPTVPRVRLFVAVHRVRGVPTGWYAHLGDLLAPAGRGLDPQLGPRLQDALFGSGVNAELAAFTVHVVASPAQGCRSARHYRTQQLAVGVAMEATVLAATAVDLGNHPFLGFDAPAVDAAYGLDGQDGGAQAQICVGAVRAGDEWEVAVRPR
ncbi:SagB-type dehydrogenase domain-containing protein [Micromonospora viridifaciens]|uniref:SagB-type dehydrogenase domain-containing protein n=1 Tax=Micromonospora viridifaciens TaxID=1881 RepID=A0A1C4ZQA2_MICVI|nr:nitroreductase family protein [Micromonospora viridifaciens]SCF35210.1 SagB-type dehydrogenase domain-containing protein [Micromonospora viridifaciens]